MELQRTDARAQKRIFHGFVSQRRFAPDVP
jgi:hypothetical protein